MRVRVVYLGILKEIAGRTSDTVDVVDGETAGDLWQRLGGEAPKLATRTIAIAINQEYASPDTALRDGDEVAFLPPVSGGAPEVAADLASAHCRITRKVIDAQTITEPIKAASDGAVCIFDGIVRDNSRGRRTLYLDYEAYEEMALKQMESLATEALGKFSVRDVRIVHRLGRLEIGESSVLIAVASAHRAAAFDACRWVIDTLKKSVPIWKKEHFEDGAVWADGDPFPPNVPTVS